MERVEFLSSRIFYRILRILRMPDSVAHAEYLKLILRQLYTVQHRIPIC